MRIKLRATGQQAIVPTPPPALQYGGVAKPVRSSRRVYTGAVSATVEAGTPATTLPPYTPPPKPPIWTIIPTSVRPTPYSTIIVKKRMP